MGVTCPYKRLCGLFALNDDHGTIGLDIIQPVQRTRPVWATALIPAIDDRYIARNRLGLSMADRHKAYLDHLGRDTRNECRAATS